MWLCLYIRGNGTQRQTHIEADDVKTQKMAANKPKNAGGYPKPGEGPGTDSPSQPQKKPALPTL